MLFKGLVTLEAFFWIFLKAVVDEVDEIIWEITIFRQARWLLIQCLQEYFHRWLVVEWWIPLRQLYRRNPKRPHIYFLIISNRLIYYFWCHPAGRSDKFVLLFAFFNGVWYAKITKHDLAITMNEHIRTLDVSVNDAERMQIWEAFKKHFQYRRQ